MILQPGTYAILNDAGNAVLEIRVITAAVNAKDGRAKPVVMTAQPAFNPATQRVTQTGWTINALDVTPVWQIVALTAAEISDASWRTAELAARAVAAAAVEEINLLRQWLADFKTQTAAATNLSNFQTRVAALPAMPQRTLTQVRTAIAAKIDAGTVD